MMQKRKAPAELPPREKAAAAKTAAVAKTSSVAKPTGVTKSRAVASAAEHPAEHSRYNLGVYLGDPARHTADGRVVRYNEDFVVLRDMYPKATVHLLVLPRSAAHCLQHPYEAFEDADFLARIRREVDAVRRLAAKELQRLLGAHSASDARRRAVLEGTGDHESGIFVESQAESPATQQRPRESEKGEASEAFTETTAVSPAVHSTDITTAAAAATAPLDGSNSTEDLPPGRDWLREIRVGVHAHPSMHHLHVHVFSRDMASPRLKHRRHYNSFQTPFLVDLADFPLAPDDPRRDDDEAHYLRRDLVCWRCHRNFGNQFQKLKAHLAEEFDAWKRE